MEDIKLKDFFNSSGDPLLLIDGSGRVLWCNSSTVYLLGLSQEQTVNFSLKDLLAPIAVENILTAKQLEMVEVDLQTKHSGNLTQTAIVVDISSGSPDDELFLIILKSFLLDKKSYQKKYKDELSAIAHDLKNPLGAVFGYADALIETSLGQGLSPAQTQLLTRIKNTASRSIDLIKNYQQLFQIQSGRIRPAETPHELNLAVQNVLDSLSFKDPSKPVFKIELTSDKMLIPLQLIQLEQTVANLVSNALKYTPSEGQISVKTWSSSERAYLSVHNTDSHIPGHELNSIFDKYTRASKGTKVSGSGLGLFIVKSILDAIGGTIKAESESDSGTLFTVGYPRVNKH